MKNLTDFRKTVEIGVDPRLIRLNSALIVGCLRVFLG